MKGEPCKRKKITIENENYYVVVGESFISATVARENANDQSRIRKAIEEFCEAVNELRGGNTG